MIKSGIINAKQGTTNIHYTRYMKYGIVFFLILFILMFPRPVIVYANGEGLLVSVKENTKITTPKTVDPPKKKPALKPQAFYKKNLHSLSIRGTFSSVDVLGDDASEEFRTYDISVSFKLPWAWYAMSGWGVGTRMMTGIGTLHNSRDTAVSVSAMAQVVFGSQDGRFDFDLGAGGAVLSRHHFGTQDFGGPFQFSLTTGISIPLIKRYAVGYRFLHYSDGGLNGSYTTGADLHMLELIYRF